MKAWENNIRKVEPYVPGEQPKDVNVVKLNTNENPYPPTPKALEAVAAFDIDRLRLYPDPEASVLIEAISNRYNINKNQIFVGVGSDDVISYIWMAVPHKIIVADMDNCDRIVLSMETYRLLSLVL